MSRAGRYIHPVRLDNIFKVDPRVKCWRVHQRAAGDVEVLLSLKEKGVAPDVAAIRNLIEDLMEGFPVQVCVVDEVPRTAAGKHRWIHSDLVSLGPQDGGAGASRNASSPPASAPSPA